MEESQNVKNVNFCLIFPLLSKRKKIWILDQSISKSKYILETFFPGKSPLKPLWEAKTSYNGYRWVIDLVMTDRHSYPKSGDAIISIKL